MHGANAIEQNKKTKSISKSVQGFRKKVETQSKKKQNPIEKKTQNHFPKVFEAFEKKWSKRNRKNRKKQNRRKKRTYRHLNFKSQFFSRGKIGLRPNLGQLLDCLDYVYMLKPRSLQDFIAWKPRQGQQP